MGPTVAHISHTNLNHNIKLIRNAVGSRKILAVVKANAYGHGDLEVSRTAIEAGCEYLGVAYVEEGLKLRHAGISQPILVFGAYDPGYLASAVDNNMEITISSEKQIIGLQNSYTSNHKIPVHLKVDTGMNRLGFQVEHFKKIFLDILNNKNFEIKGIYSHLSSADEIDRSYTDFQISRFNEIKEYTQSKCSHEILYHLANSAAIMKSPAAYFNMVRPGIMLYGQPPSPAFVVDWDLRAVLSLSSKLVSIKNLKKNEPVGYGRRFYTKDDTHIGFIPAGYADGLNRRLIKNAEVIIRSKKYPLVGTICMDMVMVDLGKDLTCEVGDPVIFYGENEHNKISICEIAGKLETIPYEITCNISSRVPRIHM